MKVIHVLPYIPIRPGDFWHDFFTGWQAITAREVAKRLRNGTVESWLPANISSPLVREAHGVIYRAFPASRGNPLSYTRMIIELGRVPNSVVHLHDLRSPTSLYFVGLKPQKVPLIYHDLGWLGNFLPSRLPFEALSFRRVARFHVHGNHSFEYLRGLGVPTRKIRIHYIGVDMNLFRPLDRDRARDVLNLPKDRRIVLFVGVFHETDGVHHVIRAVQRLKSKMGDVELVAVGGRQGEQLYDFVVQNCRFVWQRVPLQMMPYFYSAADVFCWFHNYPETLATTGLSATVEEALACGTPVVSNSLVHFPDYSEIPIIGAYARSPEELADRLESVLLEDKDENILRSIAKRHFDMDKIIGDYIEDYLAVLKEI